MKFKPLIGAAIVALAVAYVAGSAESQDGMPEIPGMDADAMAMLNDMRQAHENPITPGPFHTRIEHFIGEWDVTIGNVYRIGPDSPPVKSTGSAKVEWILGGRFAVEHLNAELNMGGMEIPLESITTTGYDNYRNLYVGSMCSNGSTEIIPFQGTISPDGKTLTYYGTMHEPMLNVTSRMIRIVSTIIDADHHTTDVYDLHAGDDFKVLEFSYQRKK